MPPLYPCFIVFSAALLTLFGSCTRKSIDHAEILPFDSTPVTHTLQPGINEISGIADSRMNAGYLWGEEDSGNPPQVYLIGHDGNVIKSIYLKGLVNRDWEDICLFDHQLYIAETGDNNLVFPDYCFYRFQEPAISTDTVYTADTIRFNYPDGSHDAEAFFIDPSTRNIYIITKRDNPSAIYRLNYPYISHNNVELTGTLPFTGVVTACISGDGSELLVKTYTNLYYHHRSPGETMEQALSGEWKQLPYKVEPQGEAMTLALDGSGLYTLSEKSFAPGVTLYFYKRK